MRNLRLLALIAPVFLLPLACEDSSGSSSGSFNPEAGAFEAGPLPEAGIPPVPEAGPDSAPPAPLGVTVTVTDEALPKNNARVILHDAAGLVIGEKATDATGKVTLPTAPSMVTVLIAHGTGAGASVAPVTFAGVADGDKLVVAAVAEVAVDPAPVGHYLVSFSGGGAAANATQFIVVAGGSCNGNGSPVASATVDLFPSCLGTKNAVLSYATNGEGILGWGFTKDVAKPAAGATINVGPQTFTVPGTKKLTATNVPASSNAYGDLSAIANGAAFRLDYANGILDNGGFTYDTPVGFAEAYQARVSVDTYNAQSTSTRIFVSREAAANDNPLTIDLATALPAITDAPQSNATPARPEVTFTTAGPLTSTDGGVATLRWSNPIAETTGSWTIVFPPSTTSIKVPALPADAAAFVPAANVIIDEVFFIEATQVPGYRELKLLPVQPNLGVDLLNTSKALPIPGTVRITRWYPGVPS